MVQKTGYMYQSISMNYLSSGHISANVLHVLTSDIDEYAKVMYFFCVFFVIYCTI